MIAVQGIYENGKVELLEKAPSKKSEVIVIFYSAHEENNQQNEEESRKIFNEFSGSIHRKIDEKKERLEALDEKYASVH